MVENQLVSRERMRDMNTGIWDLTTIIVLRSCKWMLILGGEKGLLRNGILAILHSANT